MPIVTLRDLYVAELRNVWDVEQQILQELPALAARATSGELRQLFDDHREQTRVHIERLDLLFRRLDEPAGDRPGEAIRGLIQDNRRRDGDTERGEVLDAALIAGAQRIEHYEIAAYGCLRAYAQTLGDGEAAHMLQQTLEEESDADRRLAHIAEQGIIQAAGADILAEATTYRSPLRYAAMSTLGGCSYRDYRVSNEDREDLGALDGLIVDRRSGLPVYFVVDAGGWFGGHRYVVPSGTLQPDDTARVLGTDLTRETLRRYPEFNPSAFSPLDETDACIYERRAPDAPASSENSVPQGENSIPPSESGPPRSENIASRDTETDTVVDQAAPDQPPAQRPPENEPEAAAPRIERYHER